MRIGVGQRETGRARWLSRSPVEWMRLTMRRASPVVPGPVRGVWAAIPGLLSPAVCHLPIRPDVAPREAISTPIVSTMRSWNYGAWSPTGGLQLHESCRVQSNELCVRR